MEEMNGWMSWHVWLSKSINIKRRGKTSRMQHTGPMPPTQQQQQLTEAIAAPGAMERTAKMAEAKMIFMILFD